MNEVKVIGLTARKQSGKSTIADHIEATSRGYVKRERFAGTLKSMIRVLLRDLGYSIDMIERMIDGSEADKERIIPELGKTTRQLMQSLGTEWGKMQVHPDIWNITLDRRMQKELNQSTYPVTFVIDDIRDQVEADFIKSKDGVVLKIDRPSTNDKVSTDTHASETGVDTVIPDATIINDESKRVLCARVADALEELEN